MSANDGNSVCVLGGGVVGGMSAWYLAERGFDVTVVEKDRFGVACSHGNCGYVAPSHILPLCKPGAVKNSLGTLFERNSAFSIKPRLSPRMLGWFWGFMRHCNPRDMHTTAEALKGLLFSSKDLYLDLIANAGLDCDWQEKGLLYVYGDEGALDGFAKTEAMMRERYGVGATRYDKAGVLELEPALEDNVAGGWHFEMDAHIRPDRMMQSLRGLLEARGVRIVEGSGAKSFTKNAGGAQSVVLENGEEIAADRFVVALGAWTPFLEKELGLRVPIEPGKGYSITTSRQDLIPKHPIIFEESHVAITPFEDGFRIGSTMEFVGWDTSLSEKRLRILTDAAQKHLRQPMGDEVQERWWGWRPMTPDGRPIIDRAPALSNVWLAAGHNMIGISMGTGTGKLIAEMVAGEPTHVPAEPYAVARL